MADSALKIVLGLGNPGARYRATRHNLGVRVLDRLAERRGLRFEARAAGDGVVAQAPVPWGLVLLAKSQELMNRSGRLAAALCRELDALPTQLLVVHDDADLALGKLRLRRDGSSGGHNGVRSVIEALGAREFPRLKLGVRGAGRDGRDLADYVLEPFAEDEQELAVALVERGADLLGTLLEQP